MKNTNPEMFYLVLCGLITLVIMINVWLFSALRHQKGASRPWELFKNASTRARHPWQEEDDQLKELSERVADLKKDDTKDLRNHQPPEDE